MSNAKRIIGGLALVALVAGCGGEAPSRESARDQATTHTCARLNQCGDIGAGMTLPDESACEIQWQANWDKAWPTAQCEGKIDEAQFTVCLEAIDSTGCASFVDFLATLGKCGAVNVCHSTATADGGT
ncbi:MAG TPA: DUF6184 family natural product biosynthesis lipoprotein [Polyangia bacterium]|jgi:hypothetical protein|nr:DUF6184 family natural product biosynthesis lipoprotein [Polyangia bacterium]